MIAFPGLGLLGVSQFLDLLLLFFWVAFVAGIEQFFFASLEHSGFFTFLSRLQLPTNSLSRKLPTPSKIRASPNAGSKTGVEKTKNGLVIRLEYHLGAKNVLLLLFVFTFSCEVG